MFFLDSLSSYQIRKKQILDLYFQIVYYTEDRFIVGDIFFLTYLIELCCLWKVAVTLLPETTQ